MKTIKLLSLLACLFISAGIMANDPTVKTLSNVENTANGYTKFVTSFDESTSTPLHKVSYEYDNKGNILEKIVYKWAGKQGWVANQRLTYTYNENSDPITVIFTKWNKKTNAWSEKSEQMNYQYDNEDVAVSKTLN